MKTLAPAASLWMPLTRVGLAIAFALGLAHVQAAPNEPAPTPLGAAAQGDTAKPSVKAPDARPNRHKKEVTLAPVKPPSYPSQPLPPLPTQKP